MGLGGGRVGEGGDRRSETMLHTALSSYHHTVPISRIIYYSVSQHTNTDKLQTKLGDFKQSLFH